MSQIRVQDLSLLDLARLDYGAPSKGTAYLPLQLGPGGGLAGIEIGRVKPSPTAQNEATLHMGPLAGIAARVRPSKANLDHTQQAGPLAGIISTRRQARHGSGA